MTEIRVIIEDDLVASAMVPSAAQIAKAVAVKIVELDTAIIKENLGAILLGIDDISTAITDVSKSARKLTVSIGVMKDGSLGIAGFGSTGMRLSSSFTIEFALNEQVAP